MLTQAGFDRGANKIHLIFLTSPERLMREDNLAKVQAKQVLQVQTAKWLMQSEEGKAGSMGTIGGEVPKKLNSSCLCRKQKCYDDLCQQSEIFFPILNPPALTQMLKHDETHKIWEQFSKRLNQLFLQIIINRHRAEEIKMEFN